MYELTIKNVTKSNPKIKFKDLPIGSIFLYHKFPYLKIRNVYLLMGSYSNCISIIDTTTFLFGDDVSVTPCKAQLEFEEAKDHI